MDEQKPVFDFSELSWGEAVDLSVVQARVNALSQKNDDPVATKDAFDEMHRYLSVIVADVPRDWLVKRAPDNLDFAQPESFRWLRTARFQDLMQAMNEAQAAEKK